MAYIYILKSLKNGRLYTGSTNDIRRRLFEHERGQSKYTRDAGPFKLIYKEEFSSLLQARQREKYLKSGKGREELKILLNLRE